jgi:hypothetical protein
MPEPGVDRMSIERDDVIADAEHEINQRWGEAIGENEHGPADPKLVRETAEAIVDPLLRDLRGAVSECERLRAEWRKADDGWIAAKAEVERLRSENEWLHRQRVGGQ